MSKTGIQKLDELEDWIAGGFEGLEFPDIQDEDITPPGEFPELDDLEEFLSYGQTKKTDRPGIV